MTTNTPAPRRGGRRTDTPAGKVLAAGLAGATCVGLVGVIGIRSASDAAANNTAGDQASSTEATAADVPAVPVEATSGTLTQSQLADYAAQLDAERQRLVEYRAYLVDVAAQLQAAADGGMVVTDASVSTAKKKQQKAQKPQAQPAPQRQQSHGQTQGS